LFMRGLPDLSINRAAGGGGSIDESRSYISAVKAFPTNVEGETLLTFGGGGGGFGGGGGGGSKTAVVHQSLVMLPEQPMRGRFFDPRVGYFTESFDSYDSPKPWTVTHQFITRYRLEKKDPGAAVSEPVKPIVYYISREVPEKWRAYLKKGVEDWNPAFEKAGFKNAIICKDAPTKAQDPNWDPEDARYSVIRWVAEPTMNAMGPHVHDPRSGEIISAHIIFWHDVVKLAQMWYFIQCSALDPRAKKLPLPDDLTGDLLRYICCHEVGHTLGLRHNHRASQAYSISNLRDPGFTSKYGSVASIMSYGRFNYVAQPGDGVKALIPVVGPYDDFAIEWGYKPIDAKSAADERKTLDELAARQINEPFLRFGGEDGPTSVDPTVLTENIGSDPVEATAMGLKNLDRVMDILLSATTEKGEDFDFLEEVYKSVMSHRRNWFNAVAKQVGGVVEYRTLGGRGDETFVRVPKEKQRESVRFLIATLFSTPHKMLDPKIVNQFKYSGVANDIMAQQKSVLSSLLSAGRLNRLFDAEVMGADKAYTVVELVSDLQNGIFSELKDAAPKIDPLRRNLQRAYLELLMKEFESKAAPAGLPTFPRNPSFGEDAGRVSELRSVARVSLTKLAKQIEAALPKTKDAASAAHLEDSL
ncbi:MAG TPA: zinc-dependent metalloprotease, partial [Urbifossiella sp.]